MNSRWYFFLLILSISRRSSMNLMVNNTANGYKCYRASWIVYCCVIFDILLSLNKYFLIKNITNKHDINNARGIQEILETTEIPKVDIKTYFK